MGGGMSLTKKGVVTMYIPKKIRSVPKLCFIRKILTIENVFNLTLCVIMNFSFGISIGDSFKICFVFLWMCPFFCLPLLLNSWFTLYQLYFYLIPILSSLHFFRTDWLSLFRAYKKSCTIVLFLKFNWY